MGEREKGREVIIGAEAEGIIIEERVRADGEREESRFALAGLDKAIGPTLPLGGIDEDASGVVERLDLVVRHAFAEREVGERGGTVFDFREEGEVFRRADHDKRGQGEVSREVEKERRAFDGLATSDPEEVDRFRGRERRRAREDEIAVEEAGEAAGEEERFLEASHGEAGVAVADSEIEEPATEGVSPNKFTV